MYTKTTRKGSNWQRWDLHIHTPGTLKNDCFEGSNEEEKWLNFTNSINNYPDQIAAVGVTDYFSIENYFKFIKLIEINAITKIFDLVIPNVELRIKVDTKDDKLVNLHCLFNPDYAGEVNDCFLSQLSFYYRDKKYTATKSQLIKLGRAFENNSNLEEKSALKVGANCFAVEINDLNTIFKNNPELKENCIIAVSNSSNDGASGLQPHLQNLENTGSQLEATRRNIYQTAQMIFSGNPKDRDYFLGLGVDSTDDIIQKTGSLKPCIHGSDAHCNEDLFEPSHKRFCWIKANPTFNGLKQVLHEPQDRVKIQERKPDEKSSYNVIDSVKFLDQDFISDEIPLNQNLNVIIGGKSTGKSLLLRNIARAIDPASVSSRLKEVQLTDYEEQIEDIQVLWKDKQIDELKNLRDFPKKVIYIPQSYLNRLVDKREDNTSIDNIIKDILLQDESIKDSFEELVYKNRSIDQELNNKVELLFHNIEDIKETHKQIQNIGDKEGIQIELKDLIKEVYELTKKSGLNEEEVIQHSQMKQTISSKEGELKLIDSDLRTIEARSLFPSFFSDLELQLSSKEVQISINNEFNEIKEKFTAEIQNLFKRYTLNLKKKSLELSEEIQKLKSEISPLEERLKHLTILQEKQRKITEEDKKINQILEYEKKLLLLKEEIASLVNDLKEIHSKFYENYLLHKAKILEQDIIKDDLDLKLEVQFKTNYFQSNFVDAVFNLRNNQRLRELKLLEYKYTSASDFNILLENIINSIINEKIILKSDYSQKEAILKLLKDWYVFDYQIKYNKEEISNMSPGNKSFVLLKLLIQLDKSECPILIDQPEDDLDNRSIYNDLVHFIRESKKDRQIIIATHNANLVIGADSENIIVANRHSSKTPNKLKTKFKYVNGPLELSFKSLSNDDILNEQGIQEHVCEILEGGEIAFKKRKEKYEFIN